MPSGTVTSNGRITIPKEIRERLRLRTGDHLFFLVDGTGQLIIHSRNRDIRTLYGIVRSPRRRPPSLKEMDRAIADGAAGL